MPRKTIVIGPNGEIHLVITADHVVAADQLRQRGHSAALALDLEEYVRRTANDRRAPRRKR